MAKNGRKWQKMAVESKKLTELKKYAWELSCSGKTTKQICKLVNRKPRTVDRWLADSKETLPIEIVKDETLELLDEMFIDSIKGIRTLYRAKNTPASVKAMLYLRIANSKGHLIEKKEVKHDGKLPIELDISERLDARISDLTNAIGGKSNGKQ